MRRVRRTYSLFSDFEISDRSAGDWMRGLQTQTRFLSGFTPDHEQLVPMRPFEDFEYGDECSATKPIPAMRLMTHRQ